MAINHFDNANRVASRANKRAYYSHWNRKQRVWEINIVRLGRTSQNRTKNTDLERLSCQTSIYGFHNGLPPSCKWKRWKAEYPPDELDRAQRPVQLEVSPAFITQHKVGARRHLRQVHGFDSSHRESGSIPSDHLSHRAKFNQDRLGLTTYGQYLRNQPMQVFQFSKKAKSPLK